MLAASRTSAAICLRSFPDFNPRLFSRYWRARATPGERLGFMLAQRSSGGLKPDQHAVCSECGADLTEREGWAAGPVVHCRRSEPSLKRKGPHHGRWRWRCPLCGRNLGCDRCAGRIAAEVFCEPCRVYVDGQEAINFCLEERYVLIAMVGHSAPARAISLARLAAELAVDEDQAGAILESLKQKRVPIKRIGEPACYWLDCSNKRETKELPPVGIELSLPFGDRQ